MKLARFLSPTPRRSCLIAAAFCLAWAGSANAEVHSNLPDAPLIYEFGQTNIPLVGQVFTLNSAETLESWSFSTAFGDAGAVYFEILQWDGSRPVGSAQVIQRLNFAGGAQSLGVQGLHTLLAAGTYIALADTGDVRGGADFVGFNGSYEDGGLAGGFRYSNDGIGYHDFAVPDLQYTAVFTDALPIPSAVPEPSTYALMFAGLAVIPWARGRRRSPAHGRSDSAAR